MVEVPHLEGVAYNPFAAPRLIEDELSVSEILQAGFRQENDINALMDLAAQPTFQTDPSFDVYNAVEASPFKNDYYAELGRARSQEEFDFITSRLERENKDRQLLASQGIGGILAGVAAGTISPTMLIPLTGPAKGLRGVQQAFALASGAATAQEALLFFAQETRTADEALISIAASTILGGLLGSGAVYLKGRSLDNAANDMAHARGTETISYAAGPGHARAVTPAPTSPLRDLSAEVPVYRAGEASVGDDVVVFNSSGVAKSVNVQNIADNAVTVVDEQGVSFDLGPEYTASNPRLPDYELQGDTLNLQGKVSAAGTEDILTELDELEATLSAVPATHNNPEITKLQQDYTALLSEVTRRGDDETLKLSELGELKAKFDEARAKAEELPEQHVPTKGDLPSGAESLSAAVNPASLRPGRAIKRADPVTGWVNSQMAKLNPVTRLIEQKTSPVASYWAARLADAGLILEGNQSGIAHAAEGTIESRAAAHQVALGKFVEAYDRAYVTHLKGGSPNDVVFGEIARAKVQSGLGQLPQGKLTWEEFGERTFKLVNTGETDADSSVMAGVKAQLSLFDYFRAVADEAYETQKLLKGNEARRLFDPEGNLGPDVENYIHHIFDTTEISKDPVAFQKMLADNTVERQSQAFAKAAGKYVKDRTAAEAKLAILKMPQRARTAALKAVDKELTRAQSVPVVKDYLESRKQFVDERTALRKQIKEWESTDLAEENLSPADHQRRTDELAQQIEEGKLAEEDLTLSIRNLEENQSIELQNGLQEIRNLNSYKKQITDAPKHTAKRVARAEGRLEKMEDDFRDRWRKEGAEDMDIEAGVADFRRYGQEMAELLENKISGMGPTVSGMDIVSGDRGPELSRTLNVPFAQKEKWLHKDPEYVIRRYVRQISSDVEIYRATGTANGAQIFEEINQEYFKAQKAINSASREKKIRGRWEIASEGDEGSVDLTPERRTKLQQRLRREYENVQSDMAVLIKRQRHQRGQPENANGWAFRAGRMAMDMNVIRSMGSVVPSSLADISRTVMKRGLISTFKDGYVPFVSDLTRVKLTRKQARELGIAWDPLLHNRAQAVFDMWDDNGLRQSRVEKTTGFLANKIGLVALFDKWTAEQKLIAASVGMSEASKALRIVVNGGTAKELANAKTFLAAHGIEEAMAQKIWKQFLLPGGSNEFAGGVRIPNTEKWADYRSMAAFRAMMVKFTDDTIVTPGLDRPSWVDANIGARLLAQFRSFTFTSNNRVLMSGLQQRDMALVNGVVSALAMGAVSYYTWAVSVGGDALAEANKLDLDKWADESIARSGLMGIFSEAQRVAEKVPALAPYATFSGRPVTNRQPTSILGAIAGPTYSLSEKVTNIALGLDDPTLSTLHQLRTLTPYQNVFYWRQLLDKIEESAGDISGLPERRAPQ